MESIDLKQTLKQLQKAVDDKEKYESTIGSYKELSDELMKVSTMIQDIAKRLDPIKNISERKTSRPMKPIIEELYEKAKQGTYITNDFIRMTYPEENSSRRSNIMVFLSKLDGMHKTKDGTTTRLFYQK